MKILLTGATGQLGKSVINSKPKNIELLIADREKLDFLNPKNCEKVIISEKPDWVINCAAYTNVDKAENDIELSNIVNGLAPEALAKAISHIKGNLLHISTDFVFDGKQNYAYGTKQKRNPINQYGFSKSLGEKLIEKNIINNARATILRTSWLIGPIGKNFVTVMLKLHAEKDQIYVVSDQIGAPTFTKDLASICWDIINLQKSEESTQILHWSDSGVASWYDIAEAIGEIGLELGILKKRAAVVPIKTKQYPSPARRPRYSLLDTQKTAELIGKIPIHWRKNLRKLLIEYKKLELSKS